MQNTPYRLLALFIAAIIIYAATKICFLQSAWDFVGDHHDAVIATATIGLVLVTASLALYIALLYRATVELGKRAKESAEEQAEKMERVAAGIAASAEAASQSVATSRGIAATQRMVTNLQLRAYVFAVGLANEFYPPAIGRAFYTWRIRPQWQNAGSTPTKQMRICSCAELRDTELPSIFGFPYDEANVGTGLIPPRQTLNGGAVPSTPLTVHDIEDVQNDRKFLYIWGWTQYKDVFPDTPQHVTRFCWRIIVIGNPRSFKPQSPKITEQVVFNYVYLPMGNCADEECQSLSL